MVGLGAVIFIGFLFFACTETVRFTESAVVATFGQADEDSVRSEPGLMWRWPKPIQSVAVYDTRARMLETQSETQQTSDNRQLVVRSFLTWRVSDPLKFFQSFGSEGAAEETHYRAAEQAINAQLRSAMSELSRYRMDELFSPQRGASRLGDLEQGIKARIIADGQVDQWGIQVGLVGINRVVLPEETTRDVLGRMKAAQQALATETITKGESEALKVKDISDSEAERILSFARARAAEIKNRGDMEAAVIAQRLESDPELAIFIENLRMLRNLIAGKTTLIIPTSTPGMGVFDPDRMQELQQQGLQGTGGMPSANVPTEEDGE